MLDRLTSLPVPLRRVLPALVALAIAAVIATRGVGAGLMTLAGLALVGAILLAWNSVQSLTGEAAMSLDEALGMAAPSAEEERKRAILRALKDLEYERSVGKVSEADYAELSNQYRNEAKELLRALEEQDEPARKRAQRLLEKRLENVHFDSSAKAAAKPGLAPADAEGEDDEQAPPSEPPSSDEPPPSSDAQDDELEDQDDEPTSAPAQPVAAPDKRRWTKTHAETPVARTKAAPSRACGGCRARNDLDAAFCKKCGEAMAGEDERLCATCPAVYSDEEESCPQCGVPYEA